jgi:hypothetical protein
MIYHGYDSLTKCLFSWDGDFRYEGKTDSPPIEATRPVNDDENRSLAELAGCQFLSGSYRGYFFRVESFDKEVVALIAPGHKQIVHGSWNSFFREDMNKRGMNELWKNISISACICGPAVRDPAIVAEFCRRFPAHSVYACPLVDELAAFGTLAGQLMTEKKDKPRRTSLCVPNKNVIENRDFQPFDPSLDGDGYGRMAYVVSKGIPAVNEMMTRVGISPFYGKVLSKNDGTVWIVRAEKAGAYFPHEPPSVFYAATTVPVRVRNTDKFRERTGWANETVDIVIPSEYIPDLPVFMNFYQVCSGMDFVAVSDKIDTKMPIFRYDKGYVGEKC